MQGTIEEKSMGEAAGKLLVRSRQWEIPGEVKSLTGKQTERTEGTKGSLKQK